ncbi:hypothetical protein VIBNISO65_260066 [Vibrio nigripulchritudo SO65]|nr:hypothetical protein VIBNIAM115_830027 [Vibrio nigripulchritudo AM115]CCN41593.1 hypothetical protein VIBNIFTn2_1640028 [Vibrio nigripulchritudo FTn2]CCN64994.1 hypothetical protein VIBNIPon4_300068 [Vibrio nigripulchritudo POn4]CCN77554.1 hypothetical protein VIBNISO65_260066 [Vibrio nigripulchritudo SO65]
MTERENKPIPSPAQKWLSRAVMITAFSLTWVFIKDPVGLAFSYGTYIIALIYAYKTKEI